MAATGVGADVFVTVLNDAPPGAHLAAVALAEEHGLRFIEPGDPSRIPARARLALVLTNDRLELREIITRRSIRQLSPRGGLVVDFAELDLRRGAGGLSKKQPLVRAFGSKVRRLVDATAGLGHDAARLACCGFEVTAIERHPVVFALLRDGWSRAMNDPRLAAAIGGRLIVMHDDAHTVLASSHPDGVFIDPMFPPKRKRSALAKKPIRLVRELVGDDADAATLLQVALTKAKDRVVVKRSTEAPPLGDEPDLCFEGKLVRYDVYLVGRGHAERA